MCPRASPGGSENPYPISILHLAISCTVGSYVGHCVGGASPTCTVTEHVKTQDPEFVFFLIDFHDFRYCVDKGLYCLFIIDQVGVRPPVGLAVFVVPLQECE